MIDLFTLPTRPLRSLCRVPQDLEAVTVCAEETPSVEVGVGSEAVAEAKVEAGGLPSGPARGPGHHQKSKETIG